MREFIKMSEYPLSCAKCGSYLGLVYTDEWNETTLCSKCWEENQSEKTISASTQNEQIVQDFVKIKIKQELDDKPNKAHELQSLINDCEVKIL